MTDDEYKTGLGSLFPRLLVLSTLCMAFFMYERTDGMNRVCYYNHLGYTIPYVVHVIKTCPLTIEVPHG
jgi:hypothetical protein